MSRSFTAQNCGICALCSISACWSASQSVRLAASHVFWLPIVYPAGHFVHIPHSLSPDSTRKGDFTRTACKNEPKGTMPRCRNHFDNQKTAHNPLICSLEDTLNCLCCFLSVGGALWVRDVVWCPVQCSTNALLQDVATITSCKERSSSSEGQ